MWGTLHPRAIDRAWPAPALGVAGETELPLSMGRPEEHGPTAQQEPPESGGKIHP